MKNNITFIKDISFDSKKIEDPYITEAYIPEEYNLRISETGLQLIQRNELRHAVGIVAARSHKYFSTNGEGFNVFRLRSMAIWWLRHIYNSFNWWKAYVVNAEGERKDMPMLYIGEQFGSASGTKDTEADIVLSAFENDQCITSERARGGTIFAVGYSERGGLFNSPDMYGVKTIVGNKYKGVGVNVTHSITKNLWLMAESVIKSEHGTISLQNIQNKIKKMKVVVLNRPRHKKLIQTIRGLGAEVILVKDDDLTPTLAAARNEIDLIVGVGGIPEAALSAIIVKNLGGEMSLRILPGDVAQNERLLRKISNWSLFKKNEIDILRNFKIVRPGTEKEDELPWNTILTSKELVKGQDTVFTASVIKKNPWMKFPNGKEIPGVAIHAETGEITVHVVRITNNRFEVVPIIYKTGVSNYTWQHKDYPEINSNTSGSALFHLSKIYVEFGMFRSAEECLQKAMMCKDIDDDLRQRCSSFLEYTKGLNSLISESIQTPESIIKQFEEIYRSDPHDKEKLEPIRMIKRLYEYLGDKSYHDQRNEEAISFYRNALKYSPHELKLFRKISFIQMKDLIEEYFHRIDKRYRELNYRESEDWERNKLKTALEVFYNTAKSPKFSCREPWLIFFRRTVLHGQKPSYKLAILTKLLRLRRELNQASDTGLSLFLSKEFRMTKEEIDIILRYTGQNRKFTSVGNFYYIKELSLKSLSKLLLPCVKVESQNELEDADIPLSISLVEAMEQRYKNILEELKEGRKRDAQEHSYAVAEAYHYVGLALYDEGDDDGAKIYYKEAIVKLSEIIEKFEGIIPVNALYRIGNLYEELAMLYEEELADYYKKAVDSYMCIIDEQRFIKLFGYIRGLIFIKIKQAMEKVEYLKKELLENSYAHVLK
ncbi:MAG: fructose-bisphosphatase class II [wastewater metagenome]|nr:fructose-bisphosphatase class II [Candidatus Loosdrechtia aerotolerans]